MAVRRTQQWVASAAIAGIALALAACSIRAEPPPGTEESLAALVDRVEMLPTVSAVKTSLHRGDIKDHPNDWFADVAVTTVSTDLDLASELRNAVGSGVEGAQLYMNLTIPSGDGMASTVVDPLDMVEVARADALRRLPSVTFVHLAGGRHVSLAPDATFAETAPFVLPHAGSGEIQMQRGDHSIDVTSMVPGATLLSVIDKLATDSAIAAVNFDAAGSLTQRPRLSVTTRDADRVAETLAATSDEPADAGTALRTRFTASASYDDPETQDGWVGLPLGSPPPPDELPAFGEAAPPPDLIAEDEAVVFLMEQTILAVGAEGKAEISTIAEDCVTGAGSQVRAFALVPTWSLADGVQPAFDAATAYWLDTGLIPHDRAMGTDIWQATNQRDDEVARASIRGASEGLRLSATSRCVG